MRKAYKEYKATGIQWLPKIPRHWALRRNKNIFTEHSEVVGSNSNEYDLLSLTLGGVIRRDLNAGGKFSATYDKYKIVKKGYMIFCLFDIDETPRTVGLSEYNGMITGAYTIMEINNINPLYVYFYYLSLDNNKLLKPLYTGLRKTIKANVFQSVKLPVPPREEQEQIVRFLDWKVSSINKLISIKQQEITELMELKKATISDAVTHGLDETTPMKDSGISWLGSIPQHWKTETLKRVSTLRKQKSYYNKNKDIFIGLENLKGYSNTLQETSTQYESSIQCVCKKGDLLFGKLRPYLSKVIICPKDCFCTNELLVVSFFNGNIKFLMYVFLHESFIDSVNASTYGAKMPRANDQYVLNMCIPVPPRNEQDHIVCFLDARCTEIDRLIAAKQAQITNLHDLKSILIADVVTGQIDVRDVTIPNYETVHEHADEAPDTIANSLEAAEEV